MPFCANCGAMVDESARFCQQCGAPRMPGAAATRQAAPVQMPAASRTIGILPQVRKMKMMGLYDTYTIVFTDGQAIFALLSSNVLKDMAMQAQAQGKAEGKGFLGRMGDQVSSSGNVGMRYSAMTPEQIIAESPGNFAIDYNSVGSVKLKKGFEGGDENSIGMEYTEVEFETGGGKYKYRLAQKINDAAQLLSQFYPGKIKK
jgi:hypothetical protein